jgi:hypothetical protein
MALTTTGRKTADVFAEKCCECKTVMPLEILSSAAGFYIGHYCPKCGPHDRKSGYFPDKAQANRAFSDWGLLASA